MKLIFQQLFGGKKKKKAKCLLKSDTLWLFRMRPPGPLPLRAYPGSRESPRAGP